jgi:hypothetical protein
MKELIKDQWEAVVGAVATLLTIILAIVWLITQSQYLEPIIEITTAITAFLVFFISFRAILAQTNFRTFSQEFNHQLEKFWTDFGALVKEKGQHDGVVEFFDGKDNIIEVARDSNLILKSEHPKTGDAGYLELIKFPDDLEEGSVVEYYVNAHFFKKRALLEKIPEAQIARLTAAQISYKVNESFSNFAAEATEYDDLRAIVTIKLRHKMSGQKDAREVVGLFRYLILLQLALD